MMEPSYRMKEHFDGWAIVEYDDRTTRYHRRGLTREAAEMWLEGFEAGRFVEMMTPAPHPGTKS